MNLQESIRRILKEEVNETTFFIRRVDMSLMDKEFYENLNYVTSIFLEMENEGETTTFPKFKKRVIEWNMDNYYSELTNDGENDYPYDEVYEFFSKHFHDKIKDRYDTFFVRNINDSENIIREETEYITKKILNFLQRRFEVKKIPVRDEKTSRIIKTLFFEKNGRTWTIEKGLKEIYQIAIIVDVLITFEIIDPFNVYKKDFDHNEQKIIDAIKLFINQVM